MVRRKEEECPRASHSYIQSDERLLCYRPAGLSDRVRVARGRRAGIPLKRVVSFTSLHVSVDVLGHTLPHTIIGRQIVTYTTVDFVALCVYTYTSSLHLASLSTVPAGAHTHTPARTFVVRCLMMKNDYLQLHPTSVDEGAESPLLLAPPSEAQSSRLHYSPS